MDETQRIDQETILQEQLVARETKAELERTVVLRVYNYFRIVLSFLLLIVLFEAPKQTFVGVLEPRLFQIVMLFYMAFNVTVALAVLMDDGRRLSGQTVVGSIVILDIFFLTALILASGGIDSGLGYLLVFSVAFGSVMLGAQISFTFPAIATVNSISVELYLHNTGAVEGSQHFFEVAILGGSFFVVNLFFQYVARRVADREQEVVSLEALDRMHRIAEASRSELEIANARFTALLKSTSEGVLVLDMDGRITFANMRAADLLDTTEGELIGGNIRQFLVPGKDPAEARIPKILQVLENVVDTGYDGNTWQSATGTTFLVSYSCEVSRDAGNRQTGVVVLFRNITVQRENEERVQYLANHDALTGLANRTNFKDVLASTVARSRRSNRALAILLVDTDHFTIVNEERGQAAGDSMLKAIAVRLSETVRDGDLVARLHGDQFAIMLQDLEQGEDAAMVAENLNRALAQPIVIDGNDINISVSIGITILGLEFKDADEMMNAATSAMENAKASGRDTFRFYHVDMQRKADEKRRIQMMLRNAIDNNEFKLMFQPIVSVREGNIYSSEALIRWFPKDSEPVRPDIFIPIAEESGQINAIGSWVLQSVSDQALAWNGLLGYFPSIAINVSSKQLKDHAFREQYQDILRSHQLPTDVLEMELTETGVMEDPETSLAELLKLRDLGVKISIDDFGTGYSSLDYLRRLPLDLLKIDQSFTRGIGVSDNDEEIVRVMIRMAHAMGLRVICEGVETRQQLDFLRLHGCDYCQGYYFSKPRTSDDLTELLAAVRDKRINIMEGLPQ